jgi:2-oxoglutarate ferredoxin oxidoreductase subunit beta
MTTAFLMKDYKAADPRWCTGCGDYTLLVGLRKFMVNHQLDPAQIVNISGIGCSGRIPHYMNTYGMHSIHGRAVPLALGLALTRPDLKIFVHSGDGDSLSIGGNHLLHGIHKNFNCVYVLFDNQIYGLTKNQTSPTTRKGLPTQSQPEGSWMEPINPIRFALGLGASFIATTAEWMGQHLVDTLDAAYRHPGFSFVHVAQRCPKFNPSAWHYQRSEWVTFITHDLGIKADMKAAPEAKVMTHDPKSFDSAIQFSQEVPNIFGLFYQETKPQYDVLLRAKKVSQKDPSKLLDAYVI